MRSLEQAQKNQSSIVFSTAAMFLMLSLMASAAAFKALKCFLAENRLRSGKSRKYSKLDKASIAAEVKKLIGKRNIELNVS